MKKTFLEFLVSKGHTQDQFDAMDAEAKAALYNDYNAELKAYIEKLKEDLDDKADKTEIENAVKELREAQLEQMKEMNKTLKEFGIQIKELNEKEKGQAAKNNLSLREGLEKNADRLTKLKAEEIPTAKMGEFTMTVKAPADMLISTNVSGGNVPVEQRLEGLNTIASRQVRLLDIISRRRALSNTISWVYQANKGGAAGGTDEGELKNQIDFDLVVSSETVVKRTAFIKVSTEMIDDIDFMESEIRNELMRELLKDVESQAYSGNGSAPNLRGIRTVATAFAAGTFATAVDNANNCDVLTVAMNQIMIANQGMPNYILMHPSDVTALKLVKVSATDRRYVDRLVTVGSTLNLDGVPIIPTTLVTAGEYLVGNFDLAAMYEKGDLMINVGLDGNDFTKNMRTILVEWRGLVIVKNNDRTAFVKGVFATDKAALETP